MDAFFTLSDLLSEMHVELMRREWTDDKMDRIKEASDFRGKLWDAIAAYRDSFCEKVI
jgi:hypothetical protein